MPKPVPALLLLSLVGASLASAQSVVVVDASGAAGAFTELQPAVQTVAPGGGVPVESGDYGSFDVVDKSVSIVGDPNGNVRVASSRVRGLTAEKRVLLSGLRFVPLHAEDLTRPSLELVDNHGFVFLERILTLAPQEQAALFSAGLRVDPCDGVTVVASLLFGSRGFQGFIGPGPFLYQHEAVAARGSDLALWDTFLLGGKGAKGVVAAADGGARLTAPSRVVALDASL